MPTPILLRRRKLGKGSCNGIAAVPTTGITPVRNWVQRDWPVGEISYIFRWGCTSSVEGCNSGTIVNSASSIHWCSNKRESRLAMQEAGVSVPLTWRSYTDWYNGVGSPSSLPVIIRRDTHSRGRELFYCENATAVHSICNYLATTSSSYISAVIPKVREYRVAIIQNRVAWVAQKTPADPSAIAWNVAQGGRFDNVRWDNWPRESIKAALAAMKLSGADFGGVDVMEDAEGKPYVLEINSAPSQTSPYRQSCFAKCFDWIVRNGKEHFEDLGNPRRLKDFRHPALMETL